MNYFAHFELPVAFAVDAGNLKRQFLRISKAVHPDFHSLSSPEQREETLRLSTYNNEAYRVLSDEDQRLRYILELYGQQEAEGQQKLSEDFLMDMLDLNEQVMELQLEATDQTLQQLLETIRDTRQQLADKAQPYLAKSPEDCTEADWQAIKQYYYQRRYLWRILDNLDKKDTSL